MEREKLKWIALPIFCLTTFGLYYAFDNPAALNIPLRGVIAPIDNEGLFEYRLGLMYSVYALPNIVLPFFSGRWLDKFGVHRLIIFFALLVAIGQAIISVGISIRSFALVLVGRVIFGIGGESLCVSQLRLMTEWFHGSSLGLAMGLQISASKLAVILDLILSPFIYKKISISAPFWASFAICVVSLIATIVAVRIDIVYGVPYDNVESSQVEERSFLIAVKEMFKTLRTEFERSFWTIFLIVFLLYVSQH